MNIDLNAYKTFYLVAKYKSFTKASQELFVSQPAVTQTIKKLEDQLNIELFNRSANGKITLTAAGEVVYYYAEKIFNLAVANKTVVEQARDASFEVINIGVPTHIGSFYLVKYLKMFNEKYPNVKFNIINKKSDEMIIMLKKRELDVVIDTNMNDFRDDLISTIKILDLDSCFVCSEKYKNIARKEKIELNELMRYPLILPGETTSNRKMIDYKFKEKGITLKPLIEANSSSISRQLIIEGIGIGWMIKEFVQEDIDKHILYELNVNFEQVLTPVSIAYNKKFNHDIIKEFIKIFKQNND